MAEKEENRRLSAVLIADIVGSASRMDIDEDAAIRDVSYIIDDLLIPAVIHHQGRVVKTMGDGLLAEFSSARDAFECAVAVQVRLENGRRSDTSSDIMKVRVGINLGDVIERKGDIFGSGVNIAARLEKICEPGGICISRNVYDQVRQITGVRFDYAGRHKVRNIEEPIPIYQIQFGRHNRLRLPHILRRPTSLAAIAAATMLILVSGYFLLTKDIKNTAPNQSAKRTLIDPLAMAEQEINNRARIVVVPFKTFSKFSDGDHLAIGLTEDLITDLANLPGIIVVARHTIRHWDAKRISIQELEQNHGVTYLVRGVVRGSNSQVRVNVALVLAKSGQQIWAERYDGSMQQIFRLQDRITANVIAAVGSQIPGSKAQKFTRDPIPKNHAAYLALVRGLKAKRNGDQAGHTRARQEFLTALELEPSYNRAALELAHLNLEDVLNGWQIRDDTSNSRPDQEAKIIHQIMRKITAGGSAAGYITAAKLATHQRKKLEALAYARAAIGKDPGSSEAMIAYGYSLLDADQIEQAIKAAELAIKLDPVRRKESSVLIGLCYLKARDSKAAAKYFKIAMAANGSRNSANQNGAAKAGFTLATSDAFAFAGFGGSNK